MRETTVRLIAVLAYLLVVCPARAFLAVTRRDPMRRRRDTSLSSYFEVPARG